MATIQDVSAEELARLFHHYQGALAHNVDPENGDEMQSSWDRTPVNERKRMVAAARLTLLELSAGPEPQPRPYFAKPGEAEWGC